MKPVKLPVSVATWTALLALLAALLLTWSPPTMAADDLAQRGSALQRAQAAVVGVQVLALDEARSNRTLGQARQGSGVVISDDGLVLTIGYLVLEADRVQLVLDDERTVPARVVGYDVATGFGLVQALAPLRITAVPLGRSAQLDPAVPLMMVTGGEDGAVSVAQLAARRAFSGYWEYHLDDAVFTVPARRDQSGAGLFNAQGELVGIGSLFVADVLAGSLPTGDAVEATRQPGNMFVPTDGLPAILGELRSAGTTRASRRAWLGINCVETTAGLRVVRITDDSPADVAGLQEGDRILRIDGTEVRALAGLWKALWAGGAAEREVVLDIQRDDAPQTLKVYSVDRAKTFRRPPGI
jgi:S1-C subfamily serine protease